MFPLHEDDSYNTVFHMVGLCFPRKPFPGVGNLEKGVRKHVAISNCQRQLWLTEKGDWREGGGQVPCFFSNWFDNYNYN